MTDQPEILALDFDGVLCDGMIEYFQTAWRTYCQVWSPFDPEPTPELINQLAERFYRTRPVIETGWEMPVLLRALIQGIPEAEILGNWPDIVQQFVKTDNLEASVLGPKLDQVRDQWIAEDLADWLSQHQFYPGVIARIEQVLHSPVKLFIITTKEERFTRSLLQQAGIEMPEGLVFGKGHQRPKHQTLRELSAQSNPAPRIWFVEDRIQTLLSVQQQSDLSNVQLFLGDWGYNTQAERDSASQSLDIQLLSLAQFTQPFSSWLEGV
ncbi:MAG: HAD family hydrolase [Oscillatoriales cyanobacterium RM2_1_1]|nr:HAD family hydrolase [Oscillatoriales cyanobacterium SM2_3_0]NJO44219.1 HAD family hydrolase [Oscillatoriales cyanobacterium RM2_1_1]